MAAIIDYIPRVTLSNFKELIKQQSETKETLFIRFTLKDIQYTVVMSVINAANFFWTVRRLQAGMLLAISTAFRKKVDQAVFSMDSDDWNTQYEDTGNSSIEEK